MAAEASQDAQAPVALALFKLGLIYGLEWLQNVSFHLHAYLIFPQL